MFKLGKTKKDFLESLIFTIPALLLVIITIYIPFAMSGFYSFTKWNGIAKEPIFIGFSNYVKLFRGDTEFITSIIFTVKYTFLFILFSNVFGLLLAVALNKTSNFLRGIFFIPYIMSMTIVGFIWKFIFSQGFEKFYEITGFEFLNLSWLGAPNLAFYSVLVVGVWQSVGFYMVLYIAGLQAVPKDVLEAAIVDGANASNKFFRVTLPLLKPSIITCIFMSLINGLKVFDIILALTKGGANTYSVTLNIYREAFQNNNFGLGSAKSVVFFVLVLLLTQVVLKLLGKESDS